MERLFWGIIDWLVYYISFAIGFVAGKLFRKTSDAISPHLRHDISQKPPVSTGISSTNKVSLILVDEVKRRMSEWFAVGTFISLLLFGFISIAALIKARNYFVGSDGFTHSIVNVDILVFGSISAGVALGCCLEIAKEIKRRTDQHQETQEVRKEATTPEYVAMDAVASRLAFRVVIVVAIFLVGELLLVTARNEIVNSVWRIGGGCNNTEPECNTTYVNHITFISLLVLSVGSLVLGTLAISLAKRLTSLIPVGVASPSPSVERDTVIPIIYTLAVPRSDEWDAVQSVQFVTQFLRLFPAIVFQIKATHETIVWQLVDVTASFNSELIEQALRAQFPHIEVTIDQQNSTASMPFSRYVCYYRQLNLFVAPISTADTIKQFDPLVSLTQVMSNLSQDEQVIYTVGVAGVAEDGYKEGERLVTYSTVNPFQYLTRAGLEDAIHKKQTGQDRADRFEPHDQRVLEEKLRQTLYSATVLVQVDSPNPYRTEELLVLIDSQIAHFTNAPYNGLDVVGRPVHSYIKLIQTPEEQQATTALQIYRQWVTGQGEDRPPRLILDVREIVALWHLPYRAFTAPYIQWGSKLVSVPEGIVRNAEGMLIGASKYQGKPVPVYLLPVDRRHHINLIGRTGTGKSTLLHNLIHQDIKQGAGLAVIDPHGRLVNDVLHTSIPIKRLKDVVVLDLANRDYPPPLNPLIGANQYTSTLRMVSIVEQLFTGTEQAARMSSYLRAALIPLQSYPQATMRDVVRIFMDEVFREQRLEQCDDPETQDFWDYQYNHTSPAQQRQIAEPIIHRIRPFYANPYLYPILCHPDSVDFQALIHQKKIILISLAMDIEGDAFGKIYEYFLSNFAMSEGQKGGEFFTPTALVKLIVEIIEPFHGYIYDPACGSGGMFVQSARFVIEHKRNPNAEISVYGQERVSETMRLCKMNLAVHGLYGDVREGNTYYDDIHRSSGKFDFVMANPPFNVDKVDKTKLKDDTRRFPFGMPSTDNANYLWIQLFYSALNEHGRAGFVMANSAADARGTELTIRQQLLKAKAVDVMVAIGSNFFYTVTLPCALWFLDKGKRGTEREDTVLFIDARHIFRQLDRAHRDFTPQQTEFLANIVRLYRGELPETDDGSIEMLNEAFPNGVYSDVQGLCKAVVLAEIEAQGWSLNPGRYVGVAARAPDDFDFKELLQTLNEVKCRSTRTRGSYSMEYAANAAR